MNLKRLALFCTAALLLICGIGHGKRAVAAERTECAWLRGYSISSEAMRDGLANSRLSRFDLCDAALLLPESETAETNPLRRLGSTSEEAEAPVRSDVFFFPAEHSGTAEIFEEKLPPDSCHRLPAGRAPPLSFR